MSDPRFLLDEHLPRAVAVQLRRRHVEARSVVEVGLRSRPDVEIVEWATKNGFIVVTCDDDYFGLADMSPGHAGVLFFEQSQYSIGEIVNRLAAVHATRNAESIAGLVIHL